MRFILQILFIIYYSVLFAQENVNRSFYHANLFTEDKSLIPVVSAVTGLDDGGFAYLMTFYYCALDSSFTKFDFSRKYNDTCCIEREDYSRMGVPYYTHGRSLLYKVNSNNQIEWVKSLFNYNLECWPRGNPGQAVIKQTSDKGLICTIHGRIAKYDIKGNMTWELYFDRDSISGVKKSDFLKGATVSDLQECNDGSFILLLNASFSLLKISDDGKPLWLKSTVFNEFDPHVCIMYSNITDTSINDSICLNSIKWFRGGGEEIQTYNVYETDDGGYMVIGKNNFRCKGAIYELSKEQLSEKYIYTIAGKYKNYYEVQIFPEKIYLYGYKKAGYECALEKSPVVVKTDSIGNVLWIKTFGSCMYDYPCNLIKLANNKWLVRIRDCDRSGAFPVFYTINSDGEILEKRSINVFKCDPWNLALAPDSGYYMFEQNTVTKTDKDLNILWQQGLSGAATYKFIYAVLDDGVICPDRNIFFKYDKYGHQITEKDPVIDSIFTSDTFAHFYFTFSTRFFEDKKATLIVKKKGSNGIKRIYERKYIVEKIYNCRDCPKKNLEYYIHTYPGLKVKYLYPGQFRGLKSYNDYEKWIFDISNPLHINALNIDAKDVTSPYAHESNAKKMKFDGSANVLEIRSIFGYSQVYVYNMDKGKYTYRLQYSNGRKIASGQFEIK